MAKINKEEYEILKGLDVEWNWIARDKDRELYKFLEKPRKVNYFYWKDPENTWLRMDGDNFQFIQWEDEEPYEIAELIDEYEKEYHIENAKIVKLDASKLVASNASDYKHFYKRVGESEETEMKDLKWLRKEVLDNKFRGHTIHIDVLFELMDQLDEQETKNISLQDVTHRLWELPLNDRKYWLEYLNDEFQKGYIVPLGLKTTDGKDQYLTFAGSYFASRRNKHLQQTFATLEEIPEFYRDLAERML